MITGRRAPGAHRRGERGDVAEGGGQVEVLKRARAELRRHLSRDGEHRRAVDLGVVEDGQQVDRARAGDRQAGRRPLVSLP
jgi:hypothetical protein